MTATRSDVVAFLLVHHSVLMPALIGGGLAARPPGEITLRITECCFSTSFRKF